MKKKTVKLLVRSKALPTIFIALLMGFPNPGSAADPIIGTTFNSFSLKPNGCMLIYGNLPLGGQDFFVEECRSSSKILKIFNQIGYIRKIHFITNNTAWGIVGGGLFKFDFTEQYTDVTPVKELQDKNLDLEDVFFINPSYGWACGFQGAVLRTTDGGQNWETVETGSNADFRTVKFIDNEFGWMLSRYSRDERTPQSYMVTKDGGENWERVLLPDDKIFESLDFTSPFHGCGIDGNEVLCTGDGTAWNSVKLPKESRHEIFFTDRQNGWMVGAAILKTSDGGKTWKYSLQDEDENRRKYGGLDLDNIYFADAKTGWACGAHSIYKTRDGGNSWEKISGKLIAQLEIKSGNRKKMLAKK